MHTAIRSFGLTSSYCRMALVNCTTASGGSACADCFPRGCTALCLLPLHLPHEPGKIAALRLQASKPSSRRRSAVSRLSLPRVQNSTMRPGSAREAPPAGRRRYRNRAGNGAGRPPAPSGGRAGYSCQAPAPPILRASVPCALLSDGSRRVLDDLTCHQQADDRRHKGRAAGGYRGDPCTYVRPADRCSGSGSCWPCPRADGSALVRPDDLQAATPRFEARGASHVPAGIHASPEISEMRKRLPSSLLPAPWR